MNMVSAFAPGTLAAFEALQRYRLRTTLSVIGVVLGVAGIVAIVSVSQGARADALRQFSQLGLSNVIVRYRPTAGGQIQAHQWVGLSVRDVARIRRLAPAVAAASPLVERRERVVGPRVNQDAAVFAVDAHFLPIMGLSVNTGRGLTDGDDAAMARVCVIGAHVGRALFGLADAVGRTIVVGPDPYRIIGVLRDERAVSSADTGTISPRPFDDAVILPLAALASRRSDADRWLRVDEIWVRSDEGVSPAMLGAAVDRALTVSRPGQPYYDVVVPIELFKQRLRLQRTFDVIVGSVALLTLLVAGVGIMNVMLTSVIERTAEIGLRRAVGATRSVIAGQFLAESVAISLPGGIAGLLVGAAGAVAISRVGGWPTIVSPAAIAGALVVSVGIGLLSGLYPAFRAAALSPIDAVRYE